MPGEKSREIEREIKSLYNEYMSRNDIKKEQLMLLSLALNNFEKIKFDLDRIVELTEHKKKEGLLFTDKAINEIKTLFEGIKDLCNHLYDALLTKNTVLLNYINDEINKYGKASRLFAVEHQDRLIKGICLAKSSNVYLQLLEALQDILWHLKYIVKEMQGQFP